MSMTVYTAHVYVVSEENDAYFQLSFDNEMEPEIDLKESFFEDIQKNELRKELISNSFDANLRWIGEEPYTLGDEIKSASEYYNSGTEEEFNEFCDKVEAMQNIKYVCFAVDTNKQYWLDNPAYWYDAEVFDISKRRLISIEWRGTETEDPFSFDTAKYIVGMLEQGKEDQIDTGDYVIDDYTRGKIKILSIPKNNAFDNPEFEYFNAKIIDPDTIDFNKKTIGMNPVANRAVYPDDEENKYYGALGTVFDIAQKIVEQEGGKATRSISSNTDYVVVSNRMRIREGRDFKGILDDYYAYCNYMKRDREKMQEGDERRAKKKNKPEIRTIFEDDFYAWLRNKFNEMSKGEDVFRPYGSIQIMASPFEISRTYAFRFKSDYFADIPEERMEEAAENIGKLSDFISNIESFTKEGVFAESGSSKNTYDELLQLDEKYQFSDYENVSFFYESSADVKYQIHKRNDPGFDIQHISLNQLENQSYLEATVRNTLMNGRKVKVKCRLENENEEAQKCATLLNELAEKIESIGHVESGPEEEIEAVSILFAPGREKAGEGAPLVFQKGTVTKYENKTSIDALKISDQYDLDFLREHGKSIKRIVVPEYAGSYNIRTLSHCPNVEDFIIAQNSNFSFKNGVLYTVLGKKRSIVYITKAVKELHIEKDISDVSFWHGVDKITIDDENSSFTVQDNMLLSRRRNSLYFVSSNAEEVVIPEGVKQIHADAFRYCSKLKKVVFPASYEWREWCVAPGEPMLNISEAMRDAEIVVNGDNAKLENKMVILHPDTVPEVKLYLGDQETCYIPETISSTYGFSGAFNNVKNFIVSEQNPYMAAVDGVILDKKKTKLLFYPQGRDTFHIPECVVAIGDLSLAYHDKLTDVIVPEHVVIIEKMAFANCQRLKSITAMNSGIVIADDAFLGCDFESNSTVEIIDEEAILQSIENEITSIRKKEKPQASKTKKAKATNSKSKKGKTYKYNEDLTFTLTDDFLIVQEPNDDGEQNTIIRWGEYKDEETGENLYHFSAAIGEAEYDESVVDCSNENELIDYFAGDQSGEHETRTFIVHGDNPYAFMSTENPVEVELGFFGNLVIKNFVVLLGIALKNRVLFLFSLGVRSDEGDNEDEELIFEKLVEIAEGITINGECLDLKGLDAEVLREKIGPQFNDIDDSFGLGFDFQEEEVIPDVRFADDNSRQVIIDNKWTFDLPKGLDLRFDSEHIGIMGESTTAQYVIEGLQYNGRFFFDFELHERFNDGMSSDVDVLGCRYDNDVSAGNAQQKILKDSDELYVDIVGKPIFLFRSMVMIRVRGENLRSWDFVMGMDGSDEDLQARWDEVKDLYLEMADSIRLLDAGAKAKKTARKTAKKEAVITDPDFIVQKGMLRKYIGHDENVVIPEGIKEIADSTFAGRSDLKSVVVPEGVKIIGRRCFENCVNLERAELPKSLEELGGYAFVDCHKLKEVYLSDKLKVLGDSAFSECFVMKDVKLPKKIEIIDAFTFKNCDAFTHIVIPDGVTSIGFNAFSECDNLEYLFIPESVTNFDINLGKYHPFAGSSKLTIYTPAGSCAQQFASEWDIPCINADQGTVTADNTFARTSKTTAAKTSKDTVRKDGLTDEQARQKEELARQLEELRSEAAFYSDQDLSYEDRQALQETKAGIEKLEKQFDEISADQEKYGDYLKQKEEREKKQKEEKEKKKAEKLASDDEDISVDMFVTLTNEKKMGKIRRNKDDFYKIYNDDFPTLNKKELISKRKEILEKMKDPEVCEAFSERFKSRSLQDRFDMSTHNYYSAAPGDFNDNIEEAIDNTAEWFTREEFKEVRILLNAQVERVRKDLKDQLTSVEKGWTKFHTAKKDLQIELKSFYDLNENNSFFQMEIDNDVAEVNLSTHGAFKMSTTLMNCFPWYWDKSISEIWSAALKNDILDSRIRDERPKEFAKKAFDKIKIKYPDRRESYRKKVEGFIETLVNLYESPDASAISVKSLKATIKKYFSDKKEFALCRRYMIDDHFLEKIPALAELLDEGVPSAFVYEELPRALSTELAVVVEKKAEEQKEQNYLRAKALTSSETLEDLSKAITLLNNLQGYEDADNLKNQTLTRLDHIQSEKYDKALSLAKEGTEQSLVEAISLFEEIGDFKDASKKVDVARKKLELKHKTDEIKALSRSEDLKDLNRVIELIEESREYIPKADNLIKHFSDKIDTIKREKYVEAEKLAAEMTIPSITAAIDLLQTISPYEESSNKLEEYNKLLEKEKEYEATVSLMQCMEPETLKDTGERLEKLDQYKDSKVKAQECKDKIDTIIKTESENAQALLDSQDDAALGKALGIYKHLSSFDEDESRLQSYTEKITTINEIYKLKDIKKSLNEELTKLGGVFKKKERLAVEEKISSTERKITDIRKSLSSERADRHEESHVESESPLIATEDTKVVSATTPSAAPVKKKGKTGIIIIAVIIVAALAVAGLVMSGALGNFGSSDQSEDFINEEDEVVQDITPAFTAADNLSFEEMDRKIYNYDDDVYLEVYYKVTNNGDDKIWYLGFDTIYYDASGNPINKSWANYTGCLDPGKFAYVTDSPDFEGKDPESVNKIEVRSYRYSVNNQSYELNLKTNALDAWDGALEDEKNTDYKKADILSFELTDGKLKKDEFGECIVKTKATNNGSTPVYDVGVRMEFYDSDGNSLYQNSSGFDDILQPGDTKVFDMYVEEHEEEIDSLDFISYDYKYKKKDENGFISYSLNRVIECAYGFDD